MICQECGEPILAGARFCSHCGAKVEAKRIRKCPACGWTTEEDGVYCEECGNLLVEGTDTAAQPLVRRVSETVNSFSQKATNALSQKTSPVSGGDDEGIWRQWKLASLYKGEPGLGIAQATGNLSIYHDRLVFEKKLGNAMGNLGGLMGIKIAAKKVKEKPEEVFWFQDVQSVQVGKYGGVYNSLVIHLKSGESWSVVPALPGSSEPQSAVDFVSPSLFPS